MKKRFWATLLCLLMALVLVFSFTACADSQTPEGENPDAGKDDGKDEGKEDGEVTIYLAGDSTVKTYVDAQYIAGWGQYLGDFLDGVTVSNAAQGGRSSRSFINEGRLFEGEEYKYTFSENGGKSIESVIKEGDFLFIQFGHNDDDTKSGDTMVDRMVPLGTPDEKGIYPVTAPTGKQATTYIPQEYKDAFPDSVATKEAEIKKYGDTYYAYDCGGTYKWFLKQYVDLAREKGAIPVLVTPVARVKFSGNEIVGGAGLHGENFAYVQAVRQLAEEEDCLLIDLFQETKTMLETATSTYANYLMAIVPNDLNNGPWPVGYDTAYGNTAAGFTKIEATHYNKYGAYLTAAKVAENILSSQAEEETHNGGKEYFTFADSVKTTPDKFVAPSNLISKSKVEALEDLFTTVNPTDPARVYPDPATVVALIAEVCTGEVTGENYLDFKTKCEEALASYNSLNIDDKSTVTNYDLLLQYIAKVEEQIEAHRPKPTKTVILDISAAEAGAGNQTVEYKEVYGEGSSQTGETGEVYELKFVGGDNYTVLVGAANFTYNGKEYSTSKYLSLGGSAKFGTSRYVEFTTTAACRITVVAKSSSSSADRVLSLVNASSTSSVIASFEANGSQSITSAELTSAGTYQLGSAGSGAYLYAIIIEYYE